MKAKIYNAANCSQGTASGMTKVRVSRLLGRVSFTKGAAARMGLDENSSVEFVQDAEHPRDWYVQKSTNAAAFPLLPRVCRTSVYLYIKSAGLVDAVCRSLAYEGKGFDVNIGKQTEEGLWPLITAAVR